MAVRAVECAIINDDKFRNCFGPELSPLSDSQLPQVRLHKQLAHIAKYWVGSFPCKILCGDHWQLFRQSSFSTGESYVMFGASPPRSRQTILFWRPLFQAISSQRKRAQATLHDNDKQTSSQGTPISSGGWLRSPHLTRRRPSQWLLMNFDK